LTKKVAMSKLRCQKHLFNLDPGIHYLNGAYMSPQLQSVESAGIEAMVHKRSPNRISPQDFFTNPERLRGLFAQLVHAPSADQVCLIPAVSYGMAIVAKNLKAEKGQEILVVDAQFPSNVYPWMRLAAEKGLELQVIGMPEAPPNRGKIWNERLLEAIDDRTALVSIEHAHWANGTLFDLKSIGQKVHQHGGLLVVDGTQSVGALPMNVQELGLDALICAGYKWLLGGYSLGYAWFGDAFNNSIPLEENWVNRKDSENFARLVDYQPEYQPGARRLDVGERSNFILVPMAIKALEQLLAWGTDNVQAYCRDLIGEAIPVWQAQGFLIEDAAYRAWHLFGIQVPGHIMPEVLQEQLKAQNVFVSVRGDFVRVSPNVYNDGGDVWALSGVLGRAATW